MSLFRLFLIFVKIGAILLGGGYVILPIMYSEFSEKRDLVSKDDITDFFALSQSLPGIVAANISMFVGYKLRGVRGAITAIIGIIFVPFWMIVFLASVIGAASGNRYIQGIFWGIGIAVIALIILTVREVWQKSNRDWFFYFIFVCALATLLYTKLSPVQVIIIFSLLGILVTRISNRGGAI